MTIAASYARALYELVDKSDLLGKSDLSKRYIANLRASLAKRGHLKLAPAIASEYQKLELQKARSARHSRVTPEKERVRVLLELYKKLVETK